MINKTINFINQNKTKILAILVLICAGLLMISTRLIAHSPNFTAAGGFFILAGYLIFKYRLWYLIPLPFLMYIYSDSLTGFYDYGSMGFTYLGFAVMFILPGVLSSTVNSRKLALWLSIPLVSVIFFLISNLGVWLFWDMYQHSFLGLMECYYVAIPFFKQAFGADMIFASSFLGFWFLSEKVSNNGFKFRTGNKLAHI